MDLRASTMLLTPAHFTKNPAISHTKMLHDYLLAQVQHQNLRRQNGGLHLHSSRGEVT